MSLLGTVGGNRELDGTISQSKTIVGKLSSLETIQGHSAYEVAVLNGFKGTEEEWLESLKGETPVKGVDYWTEEDKAEIVDEVNDELEKILEEAQAVVDEVEGISEEVEAAQAAAQAAEAARIAAEQARDEAQSISGGDFASVPYVDNKAATAESNANSYTDQKIAAIPTPDVSGQIEAHNTDAEAHADIRAYVNEQIAAIPTPDVSGQIAEHNADPEAHADIREYVDEQIANIDIPTGVGGGINPNLLDNWYFVNPVNQRGQTEYNGAVYGIDRWIGTSACKVALGNGVLQLSFSGSGHQWMQYLGNSNELWGKTVTLSAVMDGVLRSTTIAVPESVANGTIGQGASFANAIGLYLRSSNGRLYVSFYSSSAYQLNTVANVLAVKIELGSQQTLAREENGNRVLNEIPNYHEELLKCIQSTADSTDTCANKVVATTGQLCNPNLLDNWYFVNPVNQRGQTSYSDAGYSIDRWKLAYSSTSLVLGEKGVTLGTATTNARVMSQTLENPTPLHGKQVTFSALVDGVGLVSNTGIVPSEFPSSSQNIIPLSGFGGNTPNGVHMGSSGNLVMQFAASANNSFTLIAAKLELGDTQTLAHKDASGNWVLNELPNYHEELLKCIQSTADSADTYANKVIYHSGNKPTGTYTGNGSSTARTITTGGIGNMLLIWNTDNRFVSIVTPTGGIKCGTSDVEFETDGFAEFSNGVLTITSNVNHINKSGVTYTYQVL